MVRLVRVEKMVLSGLVFARKIARMILIQNMMMMGTLMINMALMPLYMWELWDVTPADWQTDGANKNLPITFNEGQHLQFLRYFFRHVYSAIEPHNFDDISPLEITF